MRPIAAFDTNILFSAVGWKGKPYACLELARAGKVEGVTCREVLDELSVKLQSKLSFSVVRLLAKTVTRTPLDQPARARIRGPRSCSRCRALDFSRSGYGGHHFSTRTFRTATPKAGLGKLRRALFPDQSRACYDAIMMSERARREQEGLAAEVEFAADLTDVDRIRILRDLLRTADAIRKSKSAEELRRDEEVRRSLEEPGRQRYIALWERLG